MEIKDGYNSEPMRIDVSGRAEERTMEFWIRSDKIGKSGKDEILAYMTLDEAMELKKEIEKAVKDMFGIK